MSATHEQAEEWEVGVWHISVGHIDKVGEDVSLKVVDLDKRNVVCNGESFGEGYANEQRAKKAWSACEGDGIYLVDGYACLLKCCVDNGNNVLLMCARCKLRNNTAILLVYCL